jgi:hypothetical protein
MKEGTKVVSREWTMVVSKDAQKADQSAIWRVV